MPLSSHAVIKIFRNRVSLNQNRKDDQPLRPNEDFGFNKDTISRTQSAIISSEPSYANINDKNTGDILSICSINQNVGNSNNNMMINENLKESTQKYVATRAIHEPEHQIQQPNPKNPIPGLPKPKIHSKRLNHSTQPIPRHCHPKPPKYFFRLHRPGDFPIPEQDPVRLRAGQQ
jgi:hypothetical protein